MTSDITLCSNKEVQEYSKDCDTCRRNPKNTEPSKWQSWAKFEYAISTDSMYHTIINCLHRLEQSNENNH